MKPEPLPPGAPREARPSDTSAGLAGTVRAVCVGTAVPRLIGGRRIVSAIGKRPLDAAVAVGPLGLGGDEQADLCVHGGLDKAVYAYPARHYPYWRARRQQAGVGGADDDLPPGSLGENLLIDGPDETQMGIGDEWHFPDCVLRVTAPREPCFKFNAVMGYAQASRDMVSASACGAYLAVVRPGSVRAGDCFVVVPGPRGLLVAQAFGARRIKHLR